MSSMTARDRLMLIGIVTLVILGAAWMLVVSPARNQASKVQGEVVKMHEQVSQAQSEVQNAREAQQRYRGAYASLASLGTAVPASPEVPSLIYVLDHAANNQKVEFSSIANGGTSAAGSGGSGGGSTSSSSPSSSAAGAGAAAHSSPFTQMPFTFIFNGSYEDLIHLLTQLERFTVQSSNGTLRVSGRLLTIQSITLGASQGGGVAGAGAAPSKPGQMSWTIAATAYVLAPTSSAATAPAPGGAGSATPAGSTTSSGGSSAGTPAVIKVNG